MKRRKFISAVLLSLAIVPAIFYCFIFLSQLFVQHEMNERLKSDGLVSVSIQKNEIRWIRPGKEIEINGKLFDVKNITEQNGFYIVKGLFDEKEDGIESALKKFQQPQGPSPYNNIISKISFPPLYTEDVNDDVLFLPHAQIKKYFSYDQNEFISYDPELAAPPPRA